MNLAPRFPLLVSSRGIALVAAALLWPVTTATAQIIKWKSADSVGGAPHFEATIGASVRLNASLDDYGLQGSYTFNPVNIDTTFPVDRDDNLLGLDLRQTRLKFGGIVRYESFGAVEGYVESDFVGPSGQTTLRLRKAWVDFKGWRIGQETTTFGQKQGSEPTTADFDGPPTSVTTRSGMIRYAHKSESGLQLMASLENPKVDVAYLDFVAPETRTTDQRLPDLVANVSKAGDWGYFSLSGLAREIRFRSGTSGVSEAEAVAGYGANLVGNFRLFKSEKKADVFYYQAVAGKGIGRYLVSLSGQNADAVPDPATGKLKAVPAYGGYAAYEHRWSPEFFSTIIGGGTILKNEVAPTLKDKFKEYLVMFNSFYQPITGMKIGFEVDWGRKETFTDITAEALRYYFITHYDF
jgi:DcaP outer membrane protein